MTPTSFDGRAGWLAPDGAFFALARGQSHDAWGKLYFGPGWRKVLAGAGWLRIVPELKDWLHVNRLRVGPAPSIQQMRVIKDWHAETGITINFDLPGLRMRSLTKG